MSHPDSPDSQSSQPPEDEDTEMLDAEQEEEEEEEQHPDNAQQSTSQDHTRSPRETRKDKDLNSFLNSMDKYAPVVYTYLEPRSPRSPMR
jgi:hypothetical protein